MKDFLFVVLFGLMLGSTQVHASDRHVGPLPDGGEVVPTGQVLHSAGQTAYFKNRPVDLVMPPSGRALYIKNFRNLIVIDNSSWTIRQTTNYPGTPASMHGIAIDNQGDHVYLTGVDNELYDYAINPTGTVAFRRTIYLGTNSDPCGIAISSNDSIAYVCLGRSNALALVDLSSGKITRTIRVGVAPYAVVLNHEETLAYVSDWGGRLPITGDLKGYSVGSPIVVDDRGIAASGTVSVVDLKQGSEIAEIPTGLHPSDLKLSHDGKNLYVANANSDTITVINTETRAIAETIPMRPDARLPFGSATDGLALSEDGSTLYAANAGNNAIAVVELPNAKHTNSVVQGFIPTDWYPGAVFADSKNLYVVNTKGLGSTNRDVYDLTGTVDKIAMPAPATLREYTGQVERNSHIPHILDDQAATKIRRAAVPVPERVGEPSVFQHVLYVIKENKTYDELFGDLPRGSRDPKLCVLGRKTTPNQHELALQFVLLDNYYCNGVYSTDGHAWCTEANTSDYWEKSLGAGNRSGQIGMDPLSYSSSGFIWNNVLQHGLTFHNYGVFGFSFPQPDSTWLQTYNDYTHHAGKIGFSTYIGNTPVLPAYSSTNVSGFNLKIPDQIRADGFLAEFHAAEKKRVWPAFNMLYLPDDHTAGGSVGFPTPRAQVADNDLALGRVVEAVTKSLFWSNTVVFVIEDDPQGGYDHVDGHRSICLVISPYTKRGETVTSFYNQTGLIHTMEQILGLPPMNQMDAMGPLMSDCFTSQPNYAPYTALPNEIPLDEMNPGTLSALSPRDRHWAKLSMDMDFTKPDLINDDILNRIIWHSVKGDERYPVEFAGPHGKGLKRLGLLTTRQRSTDDDDD